MNRNFIFNARKQGGSARTLNLRCGLGADKRGFGAQRALSAYEHGNLLGASCDDLSARIDGLFRGTWRYDLDARRHELLRSSGCIDVGAGEYSLSQDTGHRGFITPKYELRSRVNCDYSVSVLLSGAAHCDFTAQNSSKFSGDTYCGSNASACLRRVDANRDVHSRRDSSGSVSLRRSHSASDRLQSSMSVCSQRNFNAGVCLRRVGTKQGVYLYCKFGANRDAFLRCGFDTCGFIAKCSTQKTILGACHSLFCDASGLGSEQNPALDTFCAVRNFLSLHVARDFKNFGSVNLKKFNLAASQFVNLKKQIRADKDSDKSAEPRNLTGFGRETRVLRRLGSESKILATHGFLSEGAVGAPCGPDLGYRNCEFAQNFKRFAPDFAENFKDFTWSLEAELAQNCKISALNFTRNFKNSARGREAGSMQGFGNSGRNFEPSFSQSVKNYDRNLEPKFPQSTKNFKQNFELNLLQRVGDSEQNLSQSVKKSDRNLEAEPARGFKNQNSAQDFSRDGKNSERNFPLSFLQGIKNSDQSQNFKSARAQSHAEPSSVQTFSQCSKNSDQDSKVNSTQNQTEPVSPQELKNSEPCPAQKQEPGFYAPKFKDERARNFFSHPMRAFVLCACFFAALGALSFLAPDALAIDYVDAHKFYFLFLAPSCIYAAFLLTALPDWTNFEGSLKPVSLAFAACLIAAFIVSFLNLRLAAAITGLFWAIFFIFAAWLLWLDKNSNNFSILAVLAAFCVCSVAYGASGDEKFLLSFVHINVAAIAVVSYRISVVIGNEALREAGLKDAVFIPNFIYKNLAAFLAFALALASPFLSEAACGFIALGIGFLFLAKLRELHYAEILSRHYMAFYYGLQAACAAGYLWLGWELIREGYAAAPLHVIAICYMYGAILFVGMIAGQRHSGISPLNFPRLSRAALVLALLAGGLRAVFAGESFVLYVMIPSALFIAAVALYLINFVPIFLKNPFSADPD
ncbi:NnrS family protein [uncultured Campylobacter sp.]|uniref:NnrS family protein n=1 Tax=uncultured Campylobacter sp. TaxID=218934 RepID=UPI002617BFCC|nr:NnrS family protein [uncultured Campylobacter sp.]